jgi:hypothetical protein
MARQLEVDGRLRRAAAVLAASLAATAALSLAVPGIANADLDGKEQNAVSLLANGYNKAQRTPENDRKIDATLRQMAQDWNEPYASLRYQFDVQTGGVGELRGFFDGADVTDGSATSIAGWACLPKHASVHLNVEVSEGGSGRLLGSLVADQGREAGVSDQCSNTSDHGFNGVVAGVCTTPGAVVPVRIDAYAVDPDFPSVRQPFPSKSGTVACP